MWQLNVEICKLLMWELGVQMLECSNDGYCDVGA